MLCWAHVHLSLRIGAEGPDCGNYWAQLQLYKGLEQAGETRESERGKKGRTMQKPSGGREGLCGGKVFPSRGAIPEGEVHQVDTL